MIATFQVRTRLRAQPAVASATLQILDAGATATLLSETPVHRDMLDWWRMRTGEGMEGWAARMFQNTHLFKIEVAAFDVAVAFTLSKEGGFVDHPLDKGGPSKYGISQNAYPHLDIKNLTVEQAKDIYYADYWLKARCYLHDYPKNLCLFDIAVISGVGRALAMREMDALSLVVEQSEFYTGLSTFNTFGWGWLRRNNALQRLVNEVVRK